MDRDRAIKQTRRGLVATPATPTQIAVQKLSTLLAKACLSSIPFATLALDIGQILVDVQNERAKSIVNLSNAALTEKFLVELGERIDRLETVEKDRLKKSAVYENSAHAALRTLLAETNDKVATILARAVEGLGRSEEELTYRTQCARVIEELSEPMLHALQTNDRYYNSKLTEEERTIFTSMGLMEEIERMGVLLDRTMSLPNWDSIMRRLMQLGLIEQREDTGRFQESVMVVQTAPSTRFGRYVISLCFDDMTRPALGRFAK